jgi:hypothetical protein
MPRLNRTEQSKKALLDALEKSLGIVTTACKAAGVGRVTYYEWLKNDPDFAAAVADLSEVTLDFAESALLKNIKEGNTTAIIFYLKTKGRGRGYIERQEIDHTTKGQPIVQEIDYSKLSDAALAEIIAASAPPPGDGA